MGESSVLVVEVVSAGKEAHEEDFKIKPSEYAWAGVPLYLIVDPEVEPKTLTLLSEPKDREYTQRVEVTAGKPLPLPEPFDLALDTAALFV